MDNAKSRKASIFLSYAGSIISVIINIFWGPLLIRTLGEAEYGIYQMVASFAGYLVLMNFGTGTAMTRYVSLYRVRKDKEGEENFIATCLGITVVLAALIIMVSGVLYMLLPSLYATLSPSQLHHAKVLFALVVTNIIITLVYQAFDGIILAYEQYKIAPAWNLVKQILRTIFILCCILIIPNAIFICIADVLLSLAYLFFAIYFVKKRLQVKWALKYFDKHLIVDIASFSLAIFLQAFVNQVNSNVDKTLLGALVSPESVSVYTLAMSISTIFSTVSTALLSIYLPQFTQIVAKGGSTRELTEAAVNPCRIQFLISATVLAGFALCGRDFVTVWAGEQYSIVWTIAMILMAPMFLVYINGIVVSILDAMKKRLFRSVVLSCAAVFNIIISILLIKRIGMIGAPIGTAIATIFFSVIAMNCYYHHLGIDIFYLLRQTCRGILPCLLVAIAATFPFCFVLPVGWSGFLAKGGIFVIVLFAGLWMKGLNADEKNMLMHFRL